MDLLHFEAMLLMARKRNLVAASSVGKTPGFLMIFHRDRIIDSMAFVVWNDLADISGGEAKNARKGRGRSGNRSQKQKPHLVNRLLSRDVREPMQQQWDFSPVGEKFCSGVSSAERVEGCPEY